MHEPAPEIPPNESALGFVGSVSILCGEIAACWLLLYLITRQEKKKEKTAQQR